jgi:antitoxin ParD1/3/4
MNSQSPIRDRQAAIRGEQKRSAEIEALRVELIEGETSGEAKPFDADVFKQKMRAAHGYID